VGLEGYEIVDERAQHTALNCAVFERPLPPVDFQVWGSRTLQTLEDSNSRGSKDRKFVSTVSRIMSGHCTARSHF
jgi:hypothetical protein